jgi:16S rRNA (cytosine1402-N4)-methyltransferase
LEHTPVLLEETLGLLNIGPGDRVLDCTFGGGGHTVAMLKRAKCYVLGLDCDPDAVHRAQTVKKEFGERFDFVQRQFSKLRYLRDIFGKFDAVIFDFGISSFQLDEAKRGFSFTRCGRLDMRMAQNGLSAFDVINRYEEKDLADIIMTYGEDPKARKIAAWIVEARKRKPIETTFELADIVRRACGLRGDSKKFSKIDAATKTFQAIRIFVNREMSEISEALSSVHHVLNDNARIVTIAFHSLEGRLVKNWAKSRKDCISRINKVAIRASKNEIRDNPRSRSAMLRGFVYNSNCVSNNVVKDVHFSGEEENQ